jgi:hypothetical protein
VNHEDHALDGRTAPDESMPQIYRSMEKDGERPRIGRSATALGVRIRVEGEEKPQDIPVDDSGRVSPSTGGMSVAPAWRLLPTHRIPARLKPFCHDATGKNSLVCWKMGEGEFGDGPLAPGLNLRRDTATHGLVEPAKVVSLETYEADLAATRDHWIIDEA